MAFRDKTLVLYDGSIKIDYKDKAHRYYARERIDYDLSEENAKAWGKVMYPKGATTMIGDTLEKKGLMTWPMGLALRELFGFYDFTNEKGERMTGFSKDVGTLWDKDNLYAYSKKYALEIVLSASKAHTRKKKKGADIGAVVHNAIEHFLTNEPFDIAEAYNWEVKESEFDNEAAEKKAWEEAPEEIAQAKAAFDNFVTWWKEVKPELHGTEEIVYSKEQNMCGTYDAFLTLDGKNLLTDFKTTNASMSKEAASPEGIYYEYFIQLGIYEMARREMGLTPADDFLLVSCRKDGGFSTIYASELGLTPENCIDWAKAMITCYRLAVQIKTALLAHAPVLDQPEQKSAAKPKTGKVNNDKEEF